MADKITPEEAAAAAIAKTEPAPEPDPALVPEVAPDPEPATGNSADANDPPRPADPGLPTEEEARGAAEDRAQELADSAAEAQATQPEPPPPPEPEPVVKEDTDFVVYVSVEGQPYAGRFLTVTFRIDDQADTITLEEGVPLEVRVDVANAVTQLESPSYVIKSA